MNSYRNLMYHLKMPGEKCLVIEDFNLLRAFCEVFVFYLWIFILIVCVCYCCMIVWGVKGVLIVRMRAEVSADNENVVRLRNEFNFALKWSNKAEIKEAVLQNLLIMWNGKGDDYMSTYCYLFTYFLSYAYTFLMIYFCSGENFWMKWKLILMNKKYIVWGMFVPLIKSASTQINHAVWRKWIQRIYIIIIIFEHLESKEVLS